MKTMEELMGDDGPSEAEAEVISQDQPTTDAVNDAPPASEKPQTETTEPEKVVPTAAKAAATVPIEALKDERRKRRELERRLEDLERSVRPQEQPQVPDPVVDPAAYQRHIMVEVERQAIERERNYVANQVGEDEFRLAESAFVTAARRDTALHQAFLSHPRRAEFAYHVGRELIERQRQQEPANMEQRLQEQVLTGVARMLGIDPDAPAQAQNRAAAAVRPAVPQSMAHARSVGPRSAGPRPGGRRPIEDLYD